jgi:hypothetical protein
MTRLKLNMTAMLARISIMFLANCRSGNWGREDITFPGGQVAKSVLFGDATDYGQGQGFMGVRY